jgi:hypothetical protein
LLVVDHDAGAEQHEEEAAQERGNVG